jgi:hypothetical protein
MANQSLSGVKSVTLIEQAVNPGSTNTIWVNSATSHLILGNQNLHEIGGDISGPSESRNNAITCWDGLTGGLIKDSDVCIDDSDNITAVKSIFFVNSVSNPGAAGTTWFNARSGILNIGNKEIVDSNNMQVLSSGNLIDASSLQKTVAFVNVSSAISPTVRDVLIATSATIAKWLPSIATPTPTVAGVVPVGTTPGPVGLACSVERLLSMESGSYHLVG